MYMKCICKRDHHVKRKHVMRCSEIPERKKHECEYRDTIGRQCNWYISEATSLIMYMAVPSGNNKFLDLSKEKQSNKCMRQFMGKVHEPSKVVADFR